MTKIVPLIIAMNLVTGTLFAQQAELISILKGLDKSYVRNSSVGKVPDSFLDEYAVTHSKFKTDSALYFKAVSDFFKQPPSILPELFKYKTDTLIFCNWILTLPPYSSFIGDDGLTSKSKAALILIDCYLTNGQNKIMKRDYIEKLSYRGLDLFYRTNAKKDRATLQKEYAEFVKVVIATY